MNIYSLPALISFTINISIALIIVFDNPKETLNRWFSAFVAMFALWNLSEILILNSQNLGSAILSAQVLYRIIFLVPAFFVIIAYKFPKCFHHIPNKIAFYLLVFTIPIIFLILSFPEFHIQLINLSSLGNTFYYRLNYDVDLRFFAQLFVALIYFFWGITILLKKINKLRTVKERNQTLFFLSGFLTIIVTFIIINVFRTKLEETVSYYFLSTSLTFLISIFFLYVILHYKIFQLSRIIRSGLVYSTLSSIVLAIYVFVIQSMSVTVSEYFKINSFFFTAFLIIVMVFLMRPLEKILQNKIDNYLRKDIAVYRHNFSLFSKQLQEYKPLNEFFNVVKSFIDQNFFAGKTLLFVYNKDSDLFYNENQTKETLRLKEYKYFVESLIQLNRAVEIFEFNHERIKNHLVKYFEKHNIQIVVPFIFEGKLLAVVFVSKKKYADKFTEEEIEKLTIMADEVSLALHRNQMFEDLQNRIKERYKLEKLASIGQMTAGIAHEIRNPLNTISLSTQTLRNKGLCDEERNELMRYISEEIDRLERLLQDFLKLSKQRNIQYTSTNIEDLFDRVILSLEGKNTNNIKINKLINIEDLFITTDADVLYQTLLNLGLNSFDAISDRCSSDKSFECKNGKIEFSISTENNFYKIKVRDNGSGIDKETGDKIFDPFFTTKEEGTGLGLSIVNNLIELIGGSISYNSELGNTEFIIKISELEDKNE